VEELLSGDGPVASGAYPETVNFPTGLGRVDVVRRAGKTFTRQARSRALERDEHGREGYAQGCRCTSCVTAFRRYHRVRYATARALRGQPLNRRVPAVRAAETIELLRLQGWTTAKLAANVGCSGQTIRRVGRGEGRVWSTIERALLELAE
jgi:hypothetical protein